MSVRLREPHTRVPTRPAVKVIGWCRSAVSCLLSPDTAPPAAALTRVVVLPAASPPPG
ncbi:hypothetical protein [Saccharothrix sp. Mg75]|uniref:hypothetical protein n=1 Tax=Saccharothrix sp. Mg75 TaxID=3445357 RepID=UPI003EEA8E1E